MFIKINLIYYAHYVYSMNLVNQEMASNLL